MGGVWGSTPPENFPKFTLTLLVFEINKGKNAQKVKKN
jgi:hypothetical protein